MIEFPNTIRIPLRDIIDSIMEWLLQTLDAFFDAVGWVIVNVMLGIESVFLFIPWFILIALVFFAGWKMLGKVRSGIIMASNAFF